MSNINGKVYAMNVVTPMKVWKTWLLRLFFFALWNIKPLQQDLIDLSFIEFARWVIVPRGGFPFVGGGQQKEELKYDYLLFFSNFNGTWNQYIDAFSAVLNRGLNLVWMWSEKFPKAVPVTPFKQYIARVQFDTDYYYSAYPYATANDLKAAKVVESALEELGAGARAMTPEEFQAAYLGFAVKVQAHLGETGRSSGGVLAMGNRNGKVFGLTFLSPILNDERATPSHDLQIRYALAQLATDERSPFAKAPGTHLCRLVVMDDVIYVGMPACEEHLKSKYLVFETNCDGDAGEYLAGMARSIPNELDAIWMHCVGYPGAAGFVEYMKRCQVETSFFFAAVNDRSVEEALRGLDRQRAVADFLCKHQGLPAAELQAAFVRFHDGLPERAIPKPGFQGSRRREMKTGGHNE